MRDLLEKVIKWGDDRGLTVPENSTGQLMKFIEEGGEIVKAHNKNKIEDIIDGIGDVLVTLILYAETKNLDIEECLKSAYDEIKDRKGKLINGVFVKEEDLK